MAERSPGLETELQLSKDMPEISLNIRIQSESDHDQKMSDTSMAKFRDDMIRAFKRRNQLVDFLNKKHNMTLVVREIIPWNNDEIHVECEITDETDLDLIWNSVSDGSLMTNITSFVKEEVPGFNRKNLSLHVSVDETKYNACKSLVSAPTQYP